MKKIKFLNFHTSIQTVVNHSWPTFGVVTYKCFLMRRYLKQSHRSVQYNVNNLEFLWEIGVI